MSEPMRLIMQDKANNCGIACVAMIAGVFIEEAAAAVGRNGPTGGAELCRGLNKLGVYPCPFHRSSTFPDDAKRMIARIKNGTNWRGHWVAIWDGRVFDPARSEPIEIEAFRTLMAARGYRFVSYIRDLRSLS